MQPFVNVALVVRAWREIRLTDEGRVHSSDGGGNWGHTLFYEWHNLRFWIVLRALKITVIKMISKSSLIPLTTFILEL